MPRKHGLEAQPTVTSAVRASTVTRALPNSTGAENVWPARVSAYTACVCLAALPVAYHSAVRTAWERMRVTMRAPCSGGLLYNGRTMSSSNDSTAVALAASPHTTCTAPTRSPTHTATEHTYALTYTQTQSTRTRSHTHTATEHTYALTYTRHRDAITVMQTQ